MHELFELVSEAIRISLVLVFVTSAAYKIRHRQTFVASLQGYKLANPLATGFVATGWPVAELAVAAAVVSPWERVGGAAVVLILVLATTAMVLAMRQGVQGGCGCGGLLAESNIGMSTLARNAVLTGLAVTIAVAPPHSQLLLVTDIVDIGVVTALASAVVVIILILRGLSPFIDLLLEVRAWSKGDWPARRAVDPNREVVELGVEA